MPSVKSGRHGITPLTPIGEGLEKEQPKEANLGTDIHLQVQGFRNGAWEYVKKNPFVRYGEPGFTWHDDPTERNYRLFAALADVRNGMGFAGCYTHDPIVPWFPARGLPDGITEESAHLPNPDDYDDEEFAHYFPGRDRVLAAEQYASFAPGDDWLGDHSFTWATLEELLGASWDLPFAETGWVNRVQFEEWRTVGRPSNWSGLVGGGSIRHISNEEMAEIPLPEAPPENIFSLKEYTQVSWTRKPLTDCAFKRWVFGETMKAIADEYGGPQNVRVLMGFDS